MNIKLLFTYIVLVPHNEKERIQRQVIISSAETCQSAKNAPSEEHVVQMALGICQKLLNLLGRVLLLRTHDIVCLLICLVDLTPFFYSNYYIKIFLMIL